MILSFTTVFAAAASLLCGALLIAAVALGYARAAHSRARTAAADADVAQLRLAAVEAALADAHAKLGTLLAGQERTTAAPSRPSLREAVALSRHGASVEELVATCRIGQGEARLIQMLYGTGRDGTEPRTAARAHVN